MKGYLILTTCEKGSIPVLQKGHTSSQGEGSDNHTIKPGFRVTSKKLRSSTKFRPSCRGRAGRRHKSPSGHYEISSPLTERQRHMAISSQWLVNLSDDVTSKPKHLETQTQPSSSIFLPAMAANVISDRDPFISLGTVLCFTDIIWQELIYSTSLSQPRHKWCSNHYHPYWDKFLNKELSPQKRTGKEEGGGNKHKEIVLYWLSMKWEWSSENPTHSFLVTLLGKQMSCPFKRILLLCALEKHKEDTIYIYIIFPLPIVLLY